MSDNFEVRPDVFFPIGFEGAEEGVMVNAKYDRVDFFAGIGAYVLKILDDDNGLMSVYVSEETAQRVVAHTEIPVVERAFMYESEHEGYLTAQATLLTDEAFGGFDEVVDEL